MSQVFYTRHDGGLTMYRDGKQSTVSSDHKNFHSILAALRDKRFGEIDDLISPARKINLLGSAAKGGRKVFVRSGVVFYLDEKKREKQLDGPLVDRILEDLFKPSGKMFAEALLALLDNIMKNKRKDIRAEVYDFMMSGKAPITYDGCFLAYKKVRHDYKDIYTGKMDNSPGKVVWMKQDLVDANRHNHCSQGLHFATRGYLSAYGSNNSESDRTVIIKVNPRHIFAIPTDYQFQKGRASQYFVVGECTNGHHDEVFKDAFVDEDTKLSMEGVEFIKTGLRPSLEKVAEAYEVLKDGKVNVQEKNGKLWAVRQHTDGLWYDALGRGSDAPVKEMSFKTKTVRAAVKSALEKLGAI